MTARSFLALMVGVAAASLAAACSASVAPTSPPSTSSIPNDNGASPLATPTPATAAATATPGSTGGLSGKWSGTYSGTFAGTFTLNWQQSSSTLSGTIDLSTGGTDPISGTVNGSSIQFGTVGGSQAITYSGSVSGNTMSGSYQVKAGSSSGSGNWSATETS